MISIIIPVYNIEAYLDQCFESLILQSEQEWEAIVIDDGSVDGSGLVCDTWALRDSRFHVIHQINAGVSLARNTGLRNSNGDVIVFLDGDDYLALNALETIKLTFQNSSADAVFYGHMRIGEAGEILESRPGARAEGASNTEAVRRMLMLGKDSYLGTIWNKAFKRECLYNKGKWIDFDSRYRVGEDQIWLLCVLRNIKECVYISNTLYFYRMRKLSAAHTGISRKNALNTIAARTYMVDMVEKNWPELLPYAQIKYRHCLDQIGKEMLRSGDYQTLRQISSYGKKYFHKFLRSDDINFSAKVNSLVLQIMYCILSVS